MCIYSVFTAFDRSILNLQKWKQALRSILFLPQDLTLTFTALDPYKGFPDSSVGKESACYAGDPVSIPGSGRSTGSCTC